MRNKRTRPRLARIRTARVLRSGEIVAADVIADALGIMYRLRRTGRLEVLDLLFAHPAGLSVTDIEVRLRDFEQSEVSSMLRDLRDIGVVTFTRHKKVKVYEIRKKRLDVISGYIEALGSLSTDPAVVARRRRETRLERRQAERRVAS